MNFYVDILVFLNTDSGEMGKPYGMKSGSA